MEREEFFGGGWGVLAKTREWGNLYFSLKRYWVQLVIDLAVIHWIVWRGAVVLWAFYFG